VHQPFYKMKKQERTTKQYHSTEKKRRQKKVEHLAVILKSSPTWKETKLLTKQKRRFRSSTNPCSFLVNQSQYNGMPLTVATNLKTNTCTTQENQNYYTRK